MFQKYKKDITKLQKDLIKMQESLQGSLEKSLGSQSAQFKKGVLDLVANAQNGVPLSESQEAIEKLKKDLKDGDST